MTNRNLEAYTRAAIQSSWERCAHAYKLNPDAGNPILRLQQSEVTPRREALIEQVGGHQGIFRKLAEIAADTGQCLVMTDKDGILVRLEVKGAETEWNGIAVGSVWDERVAGTNGVSMALAEGQEVTVKGSDHFYTQLQRYSCSGAPLRDSSNEIVGVVSLSCLNRGDPADSNYARHLLDAAASRIQQTLFMRDFKDASIVSVAMPGRRELIKGAELVAVDEHGTILGATSAAHQLSGVSTHSDLTGRAFDQVFGTDVVSLDRVPGRVMSVRRDKGPLLDLWTRAPVAKTRAFPGLRDKQQGPKRRNLPTTLREFAAGSQVLAAICERAQGSVDHGVPLLVEGETGTGKSMLIKILLGNCHNNVTVDCAALSEAPEDRTYVQSLFEQGRIAGGLEKGTALVLDNVDELPSYAQIAFRRLLEEAEQGTDYPVKIVSTTRKPLLQSVQEGAFRDDLYYLLAGSNVVLPPVRLRERPSLLAQSLSDALANSRVNIRQDAQQIINAHNWPGNVRELRNVLRQALLQGDGAHISALDLAIAKPSATQPKPLAKLHVCDEEGVILDALKGAGWNVSKAARRLGIGRATINRKMKAFGISRPT